MKQQFEATTTPLIHTTERERYAIKLADFAISPAWHFAIFGGVAGLGGGLLLSGWKSPALFVAGFGITAFGVCGSIMVLLRLNKYQPLTSYAETEFSPPPEKDNRPPALVSVNSGQSIMTKTRGDKMLSASGHNFTFTGRNLDRLRAWEQAGVTTVRREGSPNAPGFVDLPDKIGSSDYSTAVYVLQQCGMIDDGNAWTDKGRAWLMEE